MWVHKAGYGLNNIAKHNRFLTKPNLPTSNPNSQLWQGNSRTAPKKIIFTEFTRHLYSYISSLLIRTVFQPSFPVFPIVLNYHHKLIINVQFLPSPSTYTELVSHVNVGEWSISVDSRFLDFSFRLCRLRFLTVWITVFLFFFFLRKKERYSVVFSVFFFLWSVFLSAHPVVRLCLFPSPYRALRIFTSFEDKCPS